jgi:hypothetical protein
MKFKRDGEKPVDPIEPGQMAPIKKGLTALFYWLVLSRIWAAANNWVRDSRVNFSN